MHRGVGKHQLAPGQAVQHRAQQRVAQHRVLQLGELVRLPQEMVRIDAMVAHNRKSSKSHSGIWRDLAVRRRKTEVDAQIAIVDALAREVGVDTPTIRRLVALIHEIEDGKRPMDWVTLDALGQSTVAAAC